MKTLNNRLFTGSTKVVWKLVQDLLQELNAEDIISTHLVSAGERLDSDGKTVHYVTAQIYYQKEAAKKSEKTDDEEE